MIKTKYLERYVKKKNTIIVFKQMPYTVGGYLLKTENENIIKINECYRQNEKYYRAILAEETGHLETTSGNLIPKKNMKPKEKERYWFYEALAKKWGTEFLIPTEMLIKKIRKKNLFSLNKMADSFFVPEYFMMYKLRFMAARQIIWELNKQLYLCLESLPDIYFEEYKGKGKD